ncbi:MAG TPA: DUF4097 family beta strand repeat-containing protein [Symbiobacteriaceae bacterium]|nr:DUF4097 family beta strand repeat-containing protein [Symbiobacteriaceae bacterium]
MKRILTLTILAALTIALAGCGQTAQAGGTCTVSEQRSATEPVAGANGVNIKAQAGTVTVVGRPGLTDVQVTATACATSESALKRIKLTTERSTDGWVRVLAEMPWGSNRLDLTVEVPEDLQVMVRSESGTVSVTDVKRGASIDSRSGSVTVTRVEGGVHVVRADSGSLAITDIKGNVTANKKSGIVVVTNVQGDLTVTGKVKGLVSYTNVTGKVNVPN